MPTTAMPSSCNSWAKRNPTCPMPTTITWPNRGMARRPKPKPAEDGSGAFLPNQAAAKSVLSRRLRDAGLGQIKTMLEANKGADRQRLVNCCGDGCR